MKNEVRYIDCDDTKEQYEQTYLNDDRKSFKKTELELLSENLRKQIAQQKWENNNERIDLDEWIKQQITSEQNAVFVTLKLDTSTMLKVLKLTLASLKHNDC